MVNNLNLIVTCPRCGEEMLVAVKRLKWIRCKKCHKGINIDPAKVMATRRDRIR